MNRKKKITVIIISILIILILVLAISFAFFSTQLNGTDQIVKVGTLDLVLDETSEGISLDNAIGISDSEGLSLEGSTFKLINNGSKAVDYTIYLDDNTIEDTDTRIDDKYLKYSLVKNGESSGATLLTSIGSNPNRVLDSGTIEGKGTNEYSLNLWITDEVDGNYSGQVFSGKLRVEVSQERKTTSETLLANIPKDNLYDDGVDTFITGEDPNNYIWYSGKLWRAVSINNESKTTKLVTQWNISAIPYNANNATFSGSYMEEWLNDTTVDGFLYNLRDPEKFIVTDAVWDATMDDRQLGSIERPNGTTTVTAPVGLLNMYEYQSSSGINASSYTNSYLNNGLQWWTLTPSSSSYVLSVNIYGSYNEVHTANAYGVRPSINLKSSVKIVDGDGTIDNPYRLEGDNDTDLAGTKLNTRYSGEYMRFGTDENNLYRIVSHENGTGTKITSAEPLKNSGTFITSAFDNSSINYSSSTTIGIFLNGEYLTSYVDSTYSDMIEDNTTWYLGTVVYGGSYRLAKYTDTNMSSTTTSTTDTKVGLLRMGELMAGQFDRYAVKSGTSSTKLTTTYGILTASGPSYIRYVYSSGTSNDGNPTDVYGVRPSMNLKSNVIITGGDGTKENPFTIELQ